MINQIGNFVGWRYGSAFSAEVTAAFANYDLHGDGLTAGEKTSVGTFVDQEVVDSNHITKDNESIYSLSGNNALVDYIGGKVSTLVNAPTQSLNGFAFNGTNQHINTNFNPSVDGSNYTRDDAQMSLFLFAASWSATNVAIGGTDGASRACLIWTGASTVQSRIHTAASITGYSGNFAANRLVTGTRDSSTVLKFYENAVAAAGSVTEASTPTTNKDMFVGALNDNGSALQWSNMTASYSRFGGSIGFNHSANNTNVRALLGSLGVTL